MSNGEDNHEVKLEENSTLVDHPDPDVEKLEKDTSHLTDMERYFPELVWEKLLDRMVKKEDVENCSKASPFFGRLLQEKRERTVVLPQILAILGQKFTDRKNRDESYEETNRDSIPWKRPAHMFTSTRLIGILKCRLVSKGWNKAIENFFEHQQQAKMKENWHSKFYTFCQFERRSADDFLEHFKESHYVSSTTTGREAGEVNPAKNPFLGRGINFSSDDMFFGFQVNYDAWLEIARKYGQGIWFLEFSICHLRPHLQISHIYRMLTEIVRLMPNLKTLVIRGISYRREGRAALDQEMADKPFPKLDNLEYIKIKLLPAAMFHQILHQNLHVTRLYADRYRENTNQDYPVLLGNFPNLSELRLDFYTVKDFEELENYPFTLNLKKVKLWFLPTPFPFLPWSRVFRALESKLNTELCTHLLVQLPDPVGNRELILRETLAYRLNFPNLHTFTLWNDAPYCLDFLLPAKNSLVHLKVIGDLEDEIVDASFYEELLEPQVIKFIDPQHNIQDSNIRTELRRLEKFTVIQYHYRSETCYEFMSDGGVTIRDIE